MGFFEKTETRELDSLLYLPSISIPENPDNDVPDEGTINDLSRAAYHTKKSYVK